MKKIAECFAYCEALPEWHITEFLGRVTIFMDWAYYLRGESQHDYFLTHDGEIELTEWGFSFLTGPHKYDFYVQNAIYFEERRNAW